MTWTATVTPELESSAYLYARSALADTERLERRVRDLERQLASARVAVNCQHDDELAELRQRLTASEAARAQLAAGLQADLPDEVYRVGRLAINVSHRLVELDGRTMRPTPRELQILAALARRPGKLLLPTDLYALVWTDEATAARVYRRLDVNFSRLRPRLAAIGAERYLLTNRERRGTLTLRGLSADCEGATS